MNRHHKDRSGGIPDNFFCNASHQQQVKPAAAARSDHDHTHIFPVTDFDDGAGRLGSLDQRPYLEPVFAQGPRNRMQEFAHIVLSLVPDLLDHLRWGAVIFPLRNGWDFAEATAIVITTSHTDAPKVMFATPAITINFRKGPKT
jgi:hypothetical protein